VFHPLIQSFAFSVIFSTTAWTDGREPKDLVSPLSDGGKSNVMDQNQNFILSYVLDSIICWSSTVRFITQQRQSLSNAELAHLKFKYLSADRHFNSTRATRSMRFDSPGDEMVQRQPVVIFVASCQLQALQFRR